MVRLLLFLYKARFNLQLSRRKRIFFDNNSMNFLYIFCFFHKLLIFQRIILTSNYYHTLLFIWILMNSLRTFYRVTPDHFFVLDQLKLPVDYEYIKVDTLQTTWKVIHDMNVRGAPLISVVATQGLSSEIFKKDF